MSNLRSRVVVIGSLLGTVMLGLLGRAFIALIALLTGGASTYLSIPGLLAAIVVGALVGAGGGYLILPLRARLARGRLARGFVLGTGVFIAFLAVSWVAGAVWGALRLGWAPALIAAAVFSVAFAFILDLLIDAMTSAQREEASGEY
jgi:hypothetical protein